MWLSMIVVVIVPWYTVTCHLNESAHEHLQPSPRWPAPGDMIKFINQLNTTWKAGRNYLDRLPVSTVDRMFGVIPPHYGYKSPLSTVKTVKIDGLPEQFDARKHWSNCVTIREIRNQGWCGACWAFGAVEAMSDRICISSGGTTQVRLSALDLLSCCTYCGYGCGGGIPDYAWAYWVKSGIVTGGEYHSQYGCRPYFIPSLNGSRSSRFLSSVDFTPQCVQQCDQQYSGTYEQDKHHGSNAYRISSDIDDIQSEIYRNWPVQVSFGIYEDFRKYESGVYQHVTGRYLSGHSIKLIGWGKENGVPYWLAANSWGTGWGEGGFVKFLRGTNECGIEEHVLAGTPDLLSMDK
ncbi:hypothetical protein RvY_11467 [Ramazzottius varieornatus]|uniref:Peptidase C1A papain C-terminal domain-containing protein n=1 Tax=Ramazzottius varieornatus TaxID=947166 RepID=A0A1D1VIL4_RAMVA|nr:hypothetical protein RvY_11467 [Ramazzottius varieornatus]